MQRVFRARDKLLYLYCFFFNFHFDESVNSVPSTCLFHVILVLIVIVADQTSYVIVETIKLLVYRFYSVVPRQLMVKLIELAMELAVYDTSG